MTTLELSRVVDSALTRALLLESPEPLDFTEEIEAKLIHRKRVGPRPPRPPRPPVGPPIALAGGPGERHTRLPELDEAILDVQPVRDGLRLLLHPAFASARELSVLVVGESPPAELYRGRIRVPIVPGSPVVLLAENIGPVPRRLPAGSEVAEALAQAKTGTVLLATNDLLDLLGRRRPQVTEVDVEIPVRVLQSGDARRVLVIPLSGVAASALSPGPYRLILRLSRRRWETTDPADSLNTYEREATLHLDL